MLGTAVGASFSLLGTGQILQSSLLIYCLVKPRPRFSLHGFFIWDSDSWINISDIVVWMIYLWLPFKIYRGDINFYWINLQVLQFLMDDVSDFLSTHFSGSAEVSKPEEKGGASTLKAFIDYISLRETENFRSRKDENKNSVTLTTIHQVLFSLDKFCLLWYSAIQ